MPDNIGRRAAMFLFSRSAVSNQSEGYIEIISEFSIRSDTKIILLGVFPGQIGRHCSQGGEMGELDRDPAISSST